MALKGAAYREAVSAVAVVLGLVFVGYQLKQANAMARMEANMSAGQRWLDWNVTVATDADLSALFARVLADDLGRADLTEGERMQVELLYTSALHGWEAGYRNWLETGSAGEFLLPENRFFMGRFSRATWPSVRSEFDRGFAQAVEDRYGMQLDARDDGA